MLMLIVLWILSWRIITGLYNILLHCVQEASLCLNFRLRTKSLPLTTYRLRQSLIVYAYVLGILLVHQVGRSCGMKIDYDANLRLLSRHSNAVILVGPTFRRFNYYLSSMTWFCKSSIYRCVNMFLICARLFNTWF